MSCILDLIAVTTEQERKALGEDGILCIHGNRTSAKRYLRKQSNNNSTDDSGSSTFQGAIVGYSTFLASGGGRQKPPLITCQTIELQTDELDADFVFPQIPPDFFAENQGVLICNPRNIQLAHPVYLEEITKPGSHFIKGKLTQTHFTMKRPDLWPISQAFRAMTTTTSKNKTPNLKLSLRAPDKMRLEDHSERDGEWLDESDKEKVDEQLVVSEEQNTTNNGHFSKSLLSSMNLLLLIMKFSGDWPMTTYKTNDYFQFKLKRKSWNYILFLLTTLFYCAITFVSILNTMTFVFTSSSHKGTFSQNVFTQVMRLEFDKYWHFVFWTYIMAMYVAYWKLALLVEDNVLVKDLLNRWSYAVTQMHYVPTESIRFRVILATVGFTVYAIVFTIFCFWRTDSAPAISGTSGVLGLLLFNNMFPHIRFSRYFFLVRFFGLVFHLYTVYAAKFSLLLIVTCAKILENAAKNWNLRFAIRFGMLMQREDKETSRTSDLNTDIPYAKLLLEHRIISAFSRHTTTVFQTPLNIYLVTKGTEIVLFLYRSLAFILIPDKVRFNETYLPPLGNSGDNHVRYRDTQAQRELGCFIAGAFVIIGWFINSRHISGCGDAILGGFKFVSRQGLIVCESVVERDFIQTLNMEFSPNLPHYLRACSKFSRQQILMFFIWAFIFTLGILSFHPFNLQKNTISFCEVDGNGEVACVQIRMSRNQEKNGRQPVEPQLQKRFSHTFIPNLTTEPSIITTTDDTPLEPPRCLDTKAIVDLDGSVKYTRVLSLVACNQAWQLVPSFNFGESYSSCLSELNLRQGVLNEANSQPYQRSQLLFDCVTHVPLDRTNRDDCGNLAFGGNPKKKPVKLFLQNPRNNDISATYVCCFDYINEPGNTASFRYCHGQSPDQMFYACSKNGKKTIDELSCHQVAQTKSPKSHITTSTTTTTATVKIQHTTADKTKMLPTTTSTTTTPSTTTAD